MVEIFFGKGRVMGKRVSALCMSLLLFLITALTAFTPAMEVQAVGKTLIVHYGGRSDNSYEGWNLWIWEEGRDGQQVDFTQEDDFGKVAIYQTNRTPSKIGFIVRLNGWEAKDIESDRFIEMNGDVVEVWLTSGQEEIATTAPEGASSFDFQALEEKRLHMYENEDALKLDVHYYNFAESYSQDTVEAYAWLGSDIGGSYPLTATDSYGAVFQIGMMQADATTAGVKIIQDQNADAALEYTIDLSKTVDNKLSVYIVEGNSNLWYDEEEAIFEPVIASASFSETSSQEIMLELSKGLTDSQAKPENFIVTDEEEQSYEVSEVVMDSDKMVTLIMKEELPLSKAYKVDLEGYMENTVSMNKILGSSYFDEQLAYDGDDLGATYTKEKTTFKVWAPTATSVNLKLYESGDRDDLLETVAMKQQDKGVWVCEKQGDLNGVYYTYEVTVAGKTNEAVDLYARTTGVNGNRGMVIDLASTNPEGFENDVRPEFKNDTDAVIYELHVRDLSSDASANIQNVGKFLGLTEKGTKTADGLPTGLDHILDLGVTHIQIMPSYDYATVDESKLDTPQFNWGYDPKNYNVPEGSYSTDPYHGEVRVKEMKQMIQTLHENGIRVNMDVVYNHTFNIVDSNFQKTVPDYYYRKNGDSYTNGSGCGNETASDRAMVRKYIVDSVVYWATEYHIDGFRFDLMAVHDMDTMNAVVEALAKIDPTIMVYGEGWNGGESGLEVGKRMLKSNMKQVEKVGAFNDDIRDGIKGNVFDSLDKGFVSGKAGMEESIKFGVVGATAHPQVLTSKNDKGSSSWAGQPGQSINYASCHDNLTLWDKLAISNPDDTEADRVKMNKLSAAIVLTSQGVPFFQAGEEMLRSKPSATKEGEFEENSYVSPDSTNSLKWDNKANVIDVYNYYKGLIAFRKAHGAFRMTQTADVQEHLVFMSGLDENVVAYTISGQPNGETAQKIVVIYNANNETTDIKLPSGEWDVCVDGNTAGVASLRKVEGTVSVEPISCMVLLQGDDTLVSVEETAAQETVSNAVEAPSKAKKTAPFVVAIAAVAAGLCGIFLKTKKKKD